MSYAEFEYELLIQEHHLDTFGHVNNATYMSIFEEARWDFITKNGYGLKEIKELGVGPVILEAKLRYQREVINRETVTIKTRTLEYPGMIGKMEQVMTRGDGAVACKAEFTFALFDLKARKLVEPSDRWLKAIGHSEARI